MKKIGLNGTSVQRIGTVIACKCPHCGHDGSFELVADLADVQGLYHHDGRADGYVVGIRRCPRPECQGQLFFSSLGGEMDFYPVQRIDFYTTDVPQAVADCLKEAIDCNSNGNEVAAAIMVRKTL